MWQSIMNSPKGTVEIFECENKALAWLGD